MRRMENFTKKVVAGFLAATVIMAGIVISPAKDVNAATEGTDVPTGVTYVAKDDVVLEGNVPVLDGYLFGGWCDANKTVLTSKDSATQAKFVPAYVLSIKSQNYVNTAWTNGTDISGANQTNPVKTTTTRLVTAVDCADYTNVGFEVIKQDGTIKDPKNVSKVYETLTANSDKITAAKLFGQGAAYMAVLELKNIPETQWDHNTYVRPYWETLDGTTVYGLPKYVRVDDGLDGYFSIAVNLKTAEEIAAGVLKVDYDENKLTYDSYYAGKVFDEMEVADKGTYVKCVGNVENIQENADANDMYIGLRFKSTGDHKIGQGTFLKFEISEVDFANNKEEIVNSIDVWDVQY